MFARLAHTLQPLKGAPARAGIGTYLPELDGLRCLAIVFVLVWHASLRASRYIGHMNSSGEQISNLYFYFPHGEVGVILFFFISGFVVCQSFLLRPRHAWDVKDFYRRRVMRIVPPYLIVMTASFIALGVVGHIPTDANAFERSSVPIGQSFLASIVFLHSLIFNAPSRLNPPMWSLEIEVAFYVALPPLMMFYVSIKSRLRRMLAISLVLGAFLVASSFIVSSVNIDLRLRLGLLCHAYLFFLGILIADFVGTTLVQISRRDTAGDLVFIAGLLLLAAVGFMMTQHDARMLSCSYALMIQSITIVSLLLVFHGAFYGRRTRALICKPWARLIGKSCYSIYLTHIAIMTAIGELLSHLVHFKQVWLIYGMFLGVLIPTSIITGLFFYLVVEQPFARLFQKKRGKPVALSMVAASR